MNFVYNPEKVTYFAETNFRNQRTLFGIKDKDRLKHIYIIGKTGMGKSTLLENLAIQDIKNNEGLGIIDPHGNLAEKVLDFIPFNRINDVIYFAPFDTDYPISFNVMEDVDPDKRYLVASSLMSAFKKIWVDVWSARMEYILNNILLALLEYPNSTLLGVNRMLSDKDYRRTVVASVTDPSVKSFWLNEFAKYGDRYMQEAGAAIQNKIGQFTTNPLIRNIIGQPKSSFNIRKIMDERKILIMNLSKGRIGEQNASLLGGMLITKIYLAAMSRAELVQSEIEKLPPFYLYVDEFQSFANDSFADILSEARKYRLSLTIAHQYIEQMTESVRAAVFGNVGTTIAFRVGPLDAAVLEKIFMPVFTAEDLINLGFTQIYLSLMIDGVGSQPFSANTVLLFPKSDISFKEKIIQQSREKYARPRYLVEKEIKEWHEHSFAEEIKEIKKEKNQLDTSSTAPQISIQQVSPLQHQAKIIKEEKKKWLPPKPKRKVFSYKNIQIPQKKVSISPKLSELLSKLEEKTKKEKDIPVSSMPTSNSSSLSSLSSTSSPNIPKEEKHKPTPQNLEALRNILQKFKEKIIKKEEEKVKKEENKNQQNSQISQSSTTFQINKSQNVSSQNLKAKEVPEEVLKKILE